MCTGPFLICTLPHAGASDVISGPFEVRTLPDALDVCLEALRGAHSPGCFGCGLDDPQTRAGAPGSRVEGGEETGAVAAGEFPKLPLSVSFFSLFPFEKFLLLDPATPYKEGPVLSHSPPLQLDWRLSRSESDRAQLSTPPAGTHGFPEFTTSSLFLSL